MDKPPVPTYCSCDMSEKRTRIADLRRMIPVSLGENDIQSLNLLGFQDGLFNVVGELVGLKELEMDGSYVSSSDFEDCSGLPQLERLSARLCGDLDGDFLSHLDCHSSLRYLDLTQTPIGDRGVLALSQFTKLKSVQLMGIGATDVGMSGFASLLDLENLDFSDNAITDNGMPSLASSVALEYLKLNKTRITDESFNIISSLRNLEEVDVTSTDVTGVGFAGFCDKACLRSLSLRLCPVTEDGLRTVGGILSLRHLDLSATQLDVDWLRHLSQLNELETLELRWIQVGDGELRQLKRLPKLRHIST